MRVVAALLLGSALLTTGCASIVNDPTVPVALSFSNAGKGTCMLSNTRKSYQVQVPAIVDVRRARSALTCHCKSTTGQTAVGAIPSSIEGEKLAASVVFPDLGITDSITEKARTYPASSVIPMP